MLYLISYDVQDDKKRNKIMKALKGWGYHLQKSVFVGDCADPREAEKIFRLVAEIADLKVDRLFMTPMCSQCYEKRKVGGDCSQLNEPAWVI